MLSDKIIPHLIIGAGPAGLGVALGLKRNYVILESKKDLGGVCGTIEFEGGIFDIGGHSFHTPHPEVRELVFNSLEMFSQKRDARCFAAEQMIPYPFQKNFRQLNAKNIVEECAEGLSHLSGSLASNYEEFILNRFGSGISKHFMLPYNRKLWGRDLKRLSANWTGERVAAPEGVKETFNTEGGQRKPLQDDTHVAYPARGGFGEIFKALGKNIEPILFQTSVRKIDHEKKEVLTSDGKKLRYENLISTIPLNELFKLFNSPVELTHELDKLEALSLKVVLAVINHPVDTEIQRVYSADPKIAAHKTAINHNSSNYLRALPQHGIMAEVSYSVEKPLARLDVDKWVIENLLEMKLIQSATEVKSTSVVDLKYAYPVPTHDRSSIVNSAKAWLEERSIHTVGRFGEWAYINSDEVLHRGLKLGQSLS